MFIEISELPETLNIDSNSVFPLVFQNATKKITFQSLLQAMNYFNAVSYNKTTGQFTFSIINGTSALLNTDLQQSFKNVSLSDGIITFTSHDGETKTINCHGQRFITSEEIAKVAQIDNKYEKPNGGIPKTDLASDVQTSLEKADSALQEHQDISGKEDKTNKTSTINENSTNTQYAGAEAIYNYVQGIKTEIETEQTEQDEHIEYLENVVKNLPKTEEKTGSSITLEDTIEGYFYHDDNEQGMLLKGNTSQHTTDGRNKFNNDDTPIVLGNNTVQKIDTGIRVTATASDGNQFVIYKLMDLSDYIRKVARMKADFVASAENLGSIKFGVCSADGSTRQSKTSTSVSGTTVNFTVPSELGDNKYLAVWLYSNNNGTVVAEDYVDYKNIIVTIDNEDMTYEPYTGGISSPNPNYEQKIKYVTGNNTVNVHGINLAHIEFEGYFRNQANGVKIENSDFNGYIAGVKPNKNYNSSFKDMATSYSSVSNLCFFDKNMHYINGNVYNTLDKTFTTPNNCYFVTMAVKNTVENFQVAEGSTEKPYEPYCTPQEKPLNLGNLEVFENGYFSRENGKWYLNNEYDKFIIDSNFTQGNPANRFVLQSTNLNKYSSSSIGLCTIGSVVGSATEQPTENGLVNFYIQPSINLLNAYVKYNSMTLTEFNTKIQELISAGKTPYLVAKLQTPLKTEITDATLFNQLEEIYKLLSNNGTTIIETECEEGNMPIVIKASALLDMSKVIENLVTRIESLESEE